MQSKVLVSTPTPPKPAYPGLYASTNKKSFGLIVLMHAEEEGVVLAQGESEYAVGYYSALWQQSSFKPIAVPVTIEFN